MGNTVDDLTLRARLRRLDSACGCEAGALAGLASAGAYIMIIVMTDLITGSVFALIAKGLVVYVLAGVVGKFAALTRIRYLRRQIRAQLARFEGGEQLPHWGSDGLR